MINKSTANAITEYKQLERLTRKKYVNGLLLLLTAQADQRALDNLTQPGKPLEEAREFYESQRTGLDQFIAASDNLISQYHALLLAVENADPDVFHGLVPPL